MCTLDSVLVRVHACVCVVVCTDFVPVCVSLTGICSYDGDVVTQYDMPSATHVISDGKVSEKKIRQLNCHSSI